MYPNKTFKTRAVSTRMVLILQFYEDSQIYRVYGQVKSFLYDFPDLAKNWDEIKFVLKEYGYYTFTCDIVPYQGVPSAVSLKLSKRLVY